MRSLLLPAALLFLLLGAALLSAGDLPVGKYRKRAADEVIARWLEDFRTKRDLVPALPPVPPSDRPAPDFAGTYRFGAYDYDLVVEQQGDMVVFKSGGVDRQDIGGAFDTIGIGTVVGDRVHARWWCLDISRNFANNGGAEMWFQGKGRDLLYVRYYHDADEKAEEGYGVRLGTHAGENLHYRIRIPHPVKEYPGGLWLRGSVRGRGGEAIANAIVLLRHEESTAVRTDREGRWAIEVESLPTVQMLSAAAPGYRNGVLAILKQDVRELDFVLEPSPYSDDPRYRFTSPEPDKGRDIFRCGNCHRNSSDEWSLSRHAQAARNPVTLAVYARDFLPALASGSAKGDAGLCAACHAPEAALDGAVARLDEVTGTAALGNHCDFCHKVHHTERLEAPGVRGSLRLGRPDPDDPQVPGPIKRVYGALADSDYLLMGPSYNPFFATSALCAGCHQYTTPEGLPALDTYAEWRDWAADRPEHETCQSCHMPTGTSMEGKSLAKRVCINALRRPEEQIHDHSFLGRDLAKTAVRLAAEARVEGDALRVTTTVESANVGHKLPTGSGDKHLLLVVLAEDAEGRALPLRDGGRLPSHAGGEGDPLALDAAALRKRLEEGDLAGLPGREFAQVLGDDDGRTHVPFWRATRVLADTRLEPGTPATAVHRFGWTVPRGKAAKVRIELWHRLRYRKDDVAAGLGTRPLDLLLAGQELEVRG